MPRNLHMQPGHMDHTIMHAAYLAACLLTLEGYHTLRIFPVCNQMGEEYARVSYQWRLWIAASGVPKENRGWCQRAGITPDRLEEL